MTKAIFSEQQYIKVRALFVGLRFSCKPFDTTRKFSPAPVFIHTESEGYAVLFRYGAIVFFNMSEESQNAFLDKLRPDIIGELNEYEREETEAVSMKSYKDGFDDNRIILKKWDIERLKTIAEVLARSVVLSYYERSISNTFDKIDPISETMNSGQISNKQGRDLLKHMGQMLSIQRKMIGQVAIYEKPELLWEMPELDSLYMRLMEAFEIIDRHTALKHKVDLIYRTADSMIGLMQDRRTLSVEWYIVILIVIEILLSLSEKIFGH